MKDMGQLFLQGNFLVAQQLKCCVQGDRFGLESLLLLEDLVAEGGEVRVGTHSDLIMVELGEGMGGEAGGGEGLTASLRLVSL